MPFWKYAGHIMGSMLLASAAMLSKETGITVLGVCILYDIFVLFTKKRWILFLIFSRNRKKDLKSPPRVIESILSDMHTFCCHFMTGIFLIKNALLWRYGSSCKFCLHATRIMYLLINACADLRLLQVYLIISPLEEKKLFEACTSNWHAPTTCPNKGCMIKLIKCFNVTWLPSKPD